MSSTRLVIAPHQTQAVSLRLQHSVRLLQMSSLDFAQSVADALADNPFLDGDADDDGGGDELPPSLLALAAEADVADGAPQAPAPERDDAFDDVGSGADAADAGEMSGELASDTAADLLDDGGDGPGTADAQDEWQDDRGAGADDWSLADGGIGEVGGSSSDGSGISATELMAQSTSLHTHLLGQLCLLPLPPRDMALAQAVIDLLDDDGYLRCDLMELMQLRLDGGSGVDNAGAVDDGSAAALPGADEVQIALRRVQSLDPAGVGARSVQECLLLQLGDVAAGQQPLLREILTHHLPLLAARDTAGIAQALRRPLAEVDAACARIRRLSPRPGWRFGASTAAYITPDVVVRRVRVGRSGGQGDRGDKGGGTQWRALLNPAVVPRVRMNRNLVDLYRQSRGSASPALASRLQEARWTLKNVEQRFCTIVAVAQAIVDRQRLFLDYGELAMKPLGLREIADAVGVHESTVSRVTCNKYVATPSGVFELKHFFSRAMVMPSGNACSGTAIRGLLRDLIAAESPKRPLTDVDLAEQLRQQGLPLARRTVTKYRQAMRIEPASARRAA